jgi:hypothetical protein
MGTQDSQSERPVNADDSGPKPLAPVEEPALKEKRPPKSDAKDPVPADPPPPAPEAESDADPVVPDQNSG